MEFEDWVCAELPGLVRFATAVTANPSVAEDIVQTVLLRMYRSWTRIGVMEHLLAYARRAVVNEYVSWRRRWSRLVLVVQIVDVQVADHAERVATRSELASRLAALPRRQRSALVLRYLLDLNDREIASIFGCSEVSVRGYVARGLRTLRIETPGSDLNGDIAHAQ